MERPAILQKSCFSRATRPRAATILERDIAQPFDVLDLADIQVFIGTFLRGCP